MPVWYCSECESPCTIERNCDPYFKPQVCIYKDTGNGFKTARWKPAHFEVPDVRFKQEKVIENEGDQL